jgi:hypothetical protein
MNRVVRYDGPVFAEPSKQYYVEVNGKSVFVHPVRVSSKLVNQLFRGKVRDLSESEISSVVHFDFEGIAHIRVVCAWEIFKAKLTPDSKAIAVSRAERNKADEVSFDITQPGQYALEINGTHCPLHIFADPIEQNKPRIDDPDVYYVAAEEKPLYCGVYTGGAAANICKEIQAACKAGKTIYFGPGIHQIDALYLEDNSKVYLDGGAIVYGSLIGNGKQNLKIFGRGILDGSRYSRDVPDSPLINSLYFANCRNVEVDGIFVRDSAIYNVATACCEDVHYNNIKIISWRPNSDGADFHNTKNVHIENSFIRCFDDCICVKGQKEYHGTACNHMPSENFLIEKTILWNDWGRALEIGAETSGDYIQNITFRDCDILHFAFIACDVQACGDAPVSHIVFENIRVGDPISNDGDPRLMEVFIRSMIWMKDEPLGSVRNVTFRDIQYTGMSIVPCRFIGSSLGNDIQQVDLENIMVNGRQLTREDNPLAPILYNEFACAIRLDGRPIDRNRAIYESEEDTCKNYQVGNGAFLRA